MTQIVTPKPSPPEPVDADRYRYGWRLASRTLPDGTEELVEVPLTVEDLLHPKEGDCIPENTLHSAERFYLYEVLDARSRNRPMVRVFSDCIINWGIPGLGNHSPDISAFANVRDRERKWKTFPVAEQKARPLFVIELVSPDDRDPRRRNNDVVIKLEHYHRARVPLYIIVDQEKEDGPRRLLGYRDTPEGYVPLIPDEQGRLLLEPVGVLLGLRDNRIVCYDATTGEEIPGYAELSKLAREAQERADAEGAIARAAQERAEAEAHARALLEARIQELEEQLKRRNGAPPEASPGS